MRTLAHLSDLHFGRTDAKIERGLQSALASLGPDLIVISGDLTQRAKLTEFREARQFLDTLPAPYLAVPGNHDIRLYDVFGRFVRPLQGYVQYISETIEPVYSDLELTVVTVNTARSLAFKGGRINAAQVRRLIAQLRSAAPGSVKVLVAHHPLDLPDTIGHALVGRARMALAALANSGLDLILSGHLHVPHFSEAAERLRVGGHTAILVQAGSAVSTRLRGHGNSFNTIISDRDNIAIRRQCWSVEKESFEVCSTARYHRVQAGWARDSSTSAA